MYLPILLFIVIIHMLFLTVFDYFENVLLVFGQLRHEQSFATHLRPSHLFKSYIVLLLYCCT